MLASLRIQNVVLIDQLTIEFQQGLCALTGETGAGKSILLDSLGLALGARSESGLVRKGAEQAQVTAVFEIEKDHLSKHLIEAQGLEFDQTLILRRSVGADGRSKAYVNDQPVSVGFLRELGDTLVEIHGQFDTQGLLNPAAHGPMLDDYADLKHKISGVWKTWKEAQSELVRLKEDAEKSRADEEYLRSALEDLDALEPQPGEEESLAALRERLMHREQVLDSLNAAYHALTAEDDPVRKAWGALDKVSDKLGEAAAETIGALQRASAEIEEAVSAIQSLSSDLEESEHNLETIDERLFALRAQARKHGCAVDDLAEMRETLAGRLNMIEHSDEVLAEAMKKVEQGRNSYIGEAEKVSKARKAAAEKLDKLVAKELPPLKLEKARFVTQVESLEEKDWGPEGIDRVRFLVATNPGAEPGALNKIASGGEMARFMLALKVVMAEVGSAGSLVFDEVDSGIGGSTAAAVGSRLARLADNRQVLVVTHSPQVAAAAKHHWIVMKGGAQETKTTVVPLAQVVERREEIARMLAGESVTDEARAAADKLLETGT